MRFSWHFIKLCQFFCGTCSIQNCYLVYDALTAAGLTPKKKNCELQLYVSKWIGPVYQVDQTCIWDRFDLYMRWIRPVYQPASDTPLEESTAAITGENPCFQIRSYAFFAELCLQIGGCPISSAIFALSSISHYNVSAMFPTVKVVVCTDIFVSVQLSVSG